MKLNYSSLTRKELRSGHILGSPVQSGCIFAAFEHCSKEDDYCNLAV